MVSKQEWQEYLEIKRQLDLIKKVEGEIFRVSYELELKKGYDPEYEDVEREIVVKGDEIVCCVCADYEEYEFKIPKEKIVES